MSLESLIPSVFKRNRNNGSTTLAPASSRQVQTTGVVTDQDVGNGLSLKYLVATVAVLNAEKIPLATRVRVHGQPARGARFVEIPINLDRERVNRKAMSAVMSPDMMKAIQAAAQVQAVIARQYLDTIVYQYQLPKDYWQYYSRSELKSPSGIGLGVGRKEVCFSLEEDTNVMVAGMTRSGKSVTIESIIFSVISGYTPEDVGLVLIDPARTFGTRKIGLTVNMLGEFTNEQHLLGPIAHTSEEIEAAIGFVYNIWKHRFENGIFDDRAIVLVIDELLHQNVLGEYVGGKYTHDDRLRMLAQLASQGLKNNIFVILGAQDPKISNTDALLLRSLARRYVGYVTDQTASQTLTGRADAQAHLLTEKGDFLEILPGRGTAGAAIVQSRFQVAEAKKLDFDNLVRGAAEGWSVVVPAVAKMEIIDSERLPDPKTLKAERRGGRPEVVIDAFTLALFFAYKGISINQAENKFGIKRRTMEKHLQFIADITEEVRRLRAGEPPRSPYYVHLIKSMQQQQEEVSS